jgi:uncharacterized protein DUF4232
MSRLALIPVVAVAAAAALAVPATAHAVPLSACSDGDVIVSSGKASSGLGHRALTLVFSLAPGAAPCTLTGYPGVDSGDGGPLAHAERTLSGYMGGVRTDAPPTVTLTATQPAHAVVEGDAFNPNGDDSCPNYTSLRVTPPDTTDTMTVRPGLLGACHFQVHPVGSTM